MLGPLRLKGGIIDDVKRSLEKYNDEYFICEIGLTEEGYKNLLNELTNKNNVKEEGYVNHK